MGRYGRAWAWFVPAPAVGGDYPAVGGDAAGLRARCSMIRRRRRASRLGVGRVGRQRRCSDRDGD
eukprot:7860106-Lingulodinium_polyedra.AAC.1